MLTSSFRAKIETLRSRSSVFDSVWKAFSIFLKCIGALPTYSVLIVWVLFIFIPILIWRICLKRRTDHLTKEFSVLCLSSEGFAVAPTRVRTYSFSEGLRHQGIDSRTFAFWDDI